MLVAGGGSPVSQRDVFSVYDSSLLIAKIILESLNDCLLAILLIGSHFNSERTTVLHYLVHMPHVRISQRTLLIPEYAVLENSHDGRS